MQAKITCRTTAKDTQTFYVNVNGKEYFLFNQEYRKSVKEHFWNGITINQINDYSNVKSNAVKRTLDKLPSYIHYIEKEYDVAIYERTKKKQKVQKVKMPYKRTPFIWQQYCWEAV